MKKTLTRLFRFGIATLIVVTSISASAADGKWNADAADNWSTATRWTNNQIADGVGAVADISFNITAARTVTLNGSRTVGLLRFEDATTSSHDWTLGVANNAVLTLQVDSGSPVINVANRTATLNPVLAGTQGFTQSGGGTLQLNNFNNTLSGNVALTAGVTRIRADGSLGQVPGAETPDAITLSGNAVLMNYETDVVLAATRGITLGTGGGRLQAGWSRALSINGPITGAQGLTIVSDATPGLISLNGANTYTGPTAVSGWLQVNGSLDAASAVTIASGGLLSGSGTVNGLVTVNANGNLGAGGLFAAGTLTVNNAVNMSGALLHIDLSATTAGVNDLLVVNGDLNLSGTTTVSVTPLAGTLETGTYRLINYTGALTGSAANLVAASSRYTITFDTSTAGQVNLIVADGPAASLVWKGDNTLNLWDLVTPNWLNGANPDVFRNGDHVLFDDNGANLVQIFAVSPLLVNSLVPGSVTVNATKNYTLGGGRLAGPMTLTKQGSGILTLSAVNGNLPNYFDGPIIIEGGRVRPTYARALGTTLGGTIISSGGALDVNGLDLGFEPISIAGAGPDGAGALVNYGGGQNNALRVVTMTGDATVGGTGRFDIRNVGGNASLSTGGNAYKLTKKGPNQFSLVGVAVDPALGDIDVQEGSFGFETTSTLGDPSKTLSMGANTTLILWSLSNPFYKPLVLGGGTAWNINNGSGTSTIEGPVTLLADSVWNVAGTSLTVSSGITGAGGLTKVGAQPLNLNGANTYAGPTVISAGNVILGATASLSNSPSIALASGTTLNVSAVAAASASGAFELNGAIAQTLSGSGTVLGNVSVGNGSGIFPGTSAGTLAVTGDLKLDGASTLFELGGTTNVGGGINDLIAVNGNLTLSGAITVRINAMAPLDTINPYTIATYTGTFDAATAVLNVVSDSRYTFTVDAVTVPGAILVRAAAVGTGAESLTWQGNVAGNETVWDLNITANWSNSLALADTFYLGDGVKFDDTAIGTGVGLYGALAPAAVTVQNETKDFAWTGPGKLTGTGGIAKSGAGKLTIANTGINDNSGVTTITAGTLEVGNGGATGNLNSAPITNAGTLVFNRSDNITVANVISGAGQLEKKGIGLMILSQAQPALTGPIAISGGTLRAGTATSLGTVAAGTTINDGGALDVNGLQLGFENIIVTGAGPNGLGAIINSSGTEQQNALRKITLAGNTTFGAHGNRWDLRTDVAASPNAILSTDGNPYNLTKVGPRDVAIVGATVDPALGDITVMEGNLGWESVTTSMGDPSRTLTLHSNANLRLWAVTNELNKNFVIHGGGSITAGSGTGNRIIGPVNLTGGLATLNSASGAIIYYSGPISGPGGIIKGDAGSVHLIAANNFTGNVIQNHGNLVFSNSLAVGTAKTVSVNYNTAISGGSGVRLYLRGGITTPADVVGVFNSATAGGDYRVSITSDVLTNTWTGPMLLQGASIVAFHCDGAANEFNITGPIIGTNGFTGTAFFRGTHGAASLSGRISGRLQLPTGTMAITDNTAWEFSNPDNLWATTSIAYGKVVLGADGAACATAPLSLGQSGTSSGTLDLNGFNQTVPSITTVNGANHWITNGSATADSMFTFAGGVNSSTLNGRIVDGTRKLSLTVNSGSLTLLGNNTYQGDTLISGGKLALGAAGTLASTPLITVASGAILDTSAKGASGLNLTTGQTLVGSGTVEGALTVGSGATLSVGPSIGAMTITGALTLAGTNVVEVNSSATPSGDLVNAGSVIYGGTLVVQNLGPAIASGNSFKLFEAAAYSGEFTEIIPATPAAGLAWDTSSLTVDGTLKVKAGVSTEPTDIGVLISGGNMELSWPLTHTGWRLEAQTNSIATGISSNWQTVPDSTATNTVIMTIDAANGAVFFRLVYP